MLPTKDRRSDWMAYLLGDSDRTWITSFLRYVFIAGLLGVGAWIIYFGFVTITWPYPIEYREGASQVMTQFLLESRNPFSLENQPLGTNIYGIAYSLVVLTPAAFFGNTLLIHRIVTFAFILLSFFLVFQTARAAHKQVVAAIVCGEFVAVALMARAGLGAFPNAMGSFLFLASILVPFNRGFDRRGLLVGALLSLIAFYTKTYFILGFGIVASYVFLFESKQKAFFYALVFVGALSLTLFLVKALLPLYLYDTLMTTWSHATRDPNHLLSQLDELAIEFYPSVIAGLVLMLAAVSSLRSGLAGLKDVLLGADFRVLSRPVFSRPLSYLAFGFLCGSLAFVVVLGPHIGSYMTYSYQLIVPSFCLWLSRSLKPKRRLDLILLAVLLANLVSYCWTRLNPRLLQPGAQSERAWQELYALVDQSDRILNSPVLVSEMLRLGKWPVDSGQIGDYYYVRESRIGSLGPPYDVIQKNGRNYLKSVAASIANQDFDRIIVTEGRSFVEFGQIRKVFAAFDFVDVRNNPRLFARYYQRTAELSIVMPQAGQKWRLAVWELKPR